jgi:hypothetical protein
VTRVVTELLPSLGVIGPEKGKRANKVLNSVRGGGAVLKQLVPAVKAGLLPCVTTPLQVCSHCSDLLGGHMSPGFSCAFSKRGSQGEHFPNGLVVTSNRILAKPSPKLSSCRLSFTELLLKQL